MPSPASAAWADLASPWQEAFSLAWNSYKAGSAPVGCVITDARGEIVARGRSRRREAAAPAGQLAGSRVAHAEINALAQLQNDGQHDGYTLYTTLESCLQCAAVTAMSHVGHVRYAAVDPLWAGLDGISKVNPYVAQLWPQIQGPLPGPFGALASLLVMVDVLTNGKEGPSLSAFRRASPNLGRVAADVIATHVMTVESLGAVLDKLWPRLSDLSSIGPSD